MTLRVSSDGRTISLVTGWLGIDPLVRQVDQRGLMTADTAGGGTTTQDGGRYTSVAGAPIVVALGPQPTRNEVLEVFRARFEFRGGPQASLTRVRPRGETLLQIGGTDPGYVRHGDLLVEEIRLVDS